MNNKQPQICLFCKREVEQLYKHHLVPRAKGGKNGEIIKCCKTCSQQIHMLFSESELQNMTLEQLHNKSEWQKYLQWISNRNGAFSVRMSTRVKHKRRRRKH